MLNEKVFADENFCVVVYGLYDMLGVMNADVIL
jgi:hypothetical protein